MVHILVNEKEKSCGIVLYRWGEGVVLNGFIERVSF